MMGFDWVAVLALASASALTFLRAYLQSPRLPFAANAPTLECLAYDLLAGAAGLRAWVIYEGQLHASMSEAFLASTFAATAAIGLGKVILYASRADRASARRRAAEDRSEHWPI